MKTIGLIGGMSWESSAEYYRIINELVSSRLGGLHSARVIMISVDFAVIERAQSEGQWEQAGAILARCACSLENAGADLVLLCTNTMHKVAHMVLQATSLPFCHIAEVTGAEIAARGLEKIGLLGTRFTMEEDFYRKVLEDLFGLAVVVPRATDADTVDRIIYKELCAGRIEADSRSAILDIIDRLVGEGAQGIILGCTELPLLIRDEDTTIPLLDTTRLHATAAVDLALADHVDR
jgi:aspartate racemase